MEKSKDNINILQQFIARAQERSKIPLKGSLQAMLDYLQYVIRSEFDKNSKAVYKFKKRTAEVDPNYINAVNAMSRSEKVRYYQSAVQFVADIDSGMDQSPASSQEMMTVDAYTRSFNLKIWKKKKIRIDRSRHLLYAEKSDKIKHYNLGDYLLRESKNKDYHSFVLEAINSSPPETGRTVHVGFSDPNKYLFWFKAIKESIDFKRWEFIFKSMGNNGDGISRASHLSYTPETRSAYKMDSHEVNHRMKPESFSDRRVKPIHSDDQRIPASSETAHFGKVADRSKKNHHQKEQEKKRSEVQIIKQTPVTYSPLKEAHRNQPGQSTHTIVDSLMQSDNDEQLQHIKEKDKVFVKEKKHLDLFHKILPDYELEDLESEENFQLIVHQTNFRVIQNQDNKRRIKVFLDFNGSYPKEAIFAAIANTSFLLRYNQSVEQVTIKTMISSQNSAIIYQKNKAYNKLYRPRDFVYIRHVFSNAGDLYIVDKSLETSSYPPFITIVRGELCLFWGILKKKNKAMLVVDINLTNQGYLTDMQELNLTMKFVQGLRMMEGMMKKQVQNLLKFKVFDLSWDITKNQANVVNNLSRIKRKTERIEIKKISSQQNLMSSIQANSRFIEFEEPEEYGKSYFHKKPHAHQKEIPKSTLSKITEQETLRVNQESIRITRRQMEKVGEIDLKEFQQRQRQKTVMSIIREFTAGEGYVIISGNFVKTKYRLKPVQSCSLVLQEEVQGHPIWKGEWLTDEKQGGLLFVNMKKIEEQKNVLRFILTKIGKNLMSGKSVLNISLPVDIFSAESNLERLSYCMTYAPVFLQRGLKKNAVDRLKLAIAFGISNSILYLNMEKPFNPILGETFNYWINGCPGYSQQISHHPPIASLYFIGRGYRVSAQLQSKVELHMNSGTGTNDGIYRIRYDDGMEICFITPGGQVSGLAYGDRKFNMVGKSYYWIERENIVLELVFNPAKKGFFSVGKQEQPIDYFQGNIYQVKPEFTNKFIVKKKVPSEKDIIRSIGKISGIWNKNVKFQNECVFDISSEYPVKLQYEVNPLPSDANWREDIAYRRIQETSRAQTEKERLEILQRNDKKLREIKGKKH